MIVNYEYNNAKLIVSHIDKNGKLKLKNYPWNNIENWVTTHENDINKSDTFHTWDNKPVKKVPSRYPNRYSIYEAFRRLPQSEQDDIFAYNEPDIYFCDIEVEITEGFPEAHLADNRVTSIALIRGSKILLMGIKDLSEKERIKMEKDTNNHFKDYNTKYTIEWMHFETETEMLHLFFNTIIKNIPVLTGWNFIKYDWVYLVTRARKLGIDPSVASPTGKLIKPWAGANKEDKDYKPIYEEMPQHRMIVDYMKVFEKWDQSIKIRENISLDFVSSKVVGTKKLEYDGTLKELFEKDWYTYLLYNCIDTALVQLIHQKQRTYDIMLSASNLSKIPIEDSFSAIRVTEGIFYDKFYDIGIIMCKQKNNITAGLDIENSEIDVDNYLGVSGGYVKFPSIGLKRWIMIFDFASLYPTTMRQFNIGPETFKGMKINDSESLLNGKIYKLEPDDIILLNGAVFSAEKGITNQLLTDIFKDRKVNKGQGLDFKKQEKLLREYKAKRFNNVA